MPTVNVYYRDKKAPFELQPFIPKLKEFLANKLSGKDIKLTPAEISIRIILIEKGDMIADIELEITAHAFPERIKKQDEICRDVMDYIKKEIPSVGDVKVWLKLCELGHSW